MQGGRGGNPAAWCQIKLQFYPTMDSSWTSVAARVQVYSTYQDTTGHHHKVYSYKITGFTRFVFVTKSVFDLPKVLDVETSWLLLIEHRGSTEVWREERAL